LWGPALPAASNPYVGSVSAFFPCYNDGEVIETIIRRVDATLERIVDTFEIIVVDDGSVDDSLSTLRRLEHELPRLRVVAHEVNRGYGAALISGFAVARHDWIFYTDGDGQYDPAQVSDLVDAVEASTDIVQGWKRKRSDSWYRTLIGRTYHHLVVMLFRLDVRDTDCDFRLVRRTLLAEARLESTSGVICVEMMRKLHEAGAHFVEVPVDHYPRRYGRSQFFRVPQIARAARGLAALWIRLMIRHDNPDSNLRPTGHS